jgi:RimJ/RimL family protein N-acetyltransferase
MVYRVMPATPVSFDYQPVLRGELLALRPLRADDYEALYQVASDPLIWEQHPVRNRYEPETFRGFFRESLESGGALVAIDRATGEIIGSSRFYRHDPMRSEVEIGWTFLARRYWGGRYNGEMKRLMLQHAFQFVAHVVFLIGPQNYRSQAAIRKIGGEYVGMRPDGRGGESCVFQISADREAGR